MLSLEKHAKKAFRLGCHSAFFAKCACPNSTVQHTVVNTVPCPSVCKHWQDKWTRGHWRALHLSITFLLLPQTSSQLIPPSYLFSPPLFLTPPLHHYLITSQAHFPFLSHHGIHLPSDFCHNVISLTFLSFIIFYSSYLPLPSFLSLPFSISER